MTAGILAIASGCPEGEVVDDGLGSASSEDSGSGGSTTESSTSGSSASGSTTASTAPPTSTADGTSTSSGTETDTDGALCPEPEPPRSQEAILEVRVTVHNDTDQSYYVIDETDMCDAYGLHDGADSLVLQDPWRCGCECPPPAPGTATLMEIAPGQTHEVLWDGRAMTTYTVYEYCEFDGDCVGEDAGVPQQVPPGTLTMTLPIYDGPEYEWPDEGTGIIERCESPLRIDLEFDLGTEDLQLDVNLSDVVPPA